MTGAPTSGALCWPRRSRARSGVWIAEAPLPRQHHPHHRSHSRPFLWSRPHQPRRGASWKQRRKKENIPRAMGEDGVARVRAKARARANGQRDESVGGDGKHATPRRLRTRLGETERACLSHVYVYSYRISHTRHTPAPRPAARHGTVNMSRMFQWIARKLGDRLPTWHVCPQLTLPRLNPHAASSTQRVAHHIVVATGVAANPKDDVPQLHPAIRPSPVGHARRVFQKVA